MSLLSTIKKILPSSSRSLHAMHEDIPWMVHPDSGLSVQRGDVDLEALRTVASSAEIDLFQSVFDSYSEKTHDLGLLADESCGDFAYAIDNVFDAPKRKIIWDCNDILPVRKHPFDGFSFFGSRESGKGC